MEELIYLAERPSVRTSCHGDDYDDEHVGDVGDELADRDAGLTATQAARTGPRTGRPGGLIR